MIGQSGERVDQLTAASWRYLSKVSGRGALSQPRGTWGATVEPFVAEDADHYFDHPLGSWIDHAACAEADPRLFDCDTRENGDAFDVDRGREAVTEFCARCPVAAECLVEGARATGVWGGDARANRAPRDRLRQLMSGLLAPEPEPESEPTPVTKPRRRSTPHPETVARNEAIREWASANGYVIAARGRLPLTVRAAYDAAHAA